MSREGRIMIVKLAVAGDMMGLSAALNNVAHEVTAETLEPTLLKRIRDSDFVSFLDTQGSRRQDQHGYCPGIS
jgi:CRP/FNR family transcriptional regulator